MRKNNVLIPIHVLMAVCLMVPLAHADNKKDADWHKKIDGKIQEIFGKLNLTDAQKQALENNKLKHRSQMKDVSTKIKSHKEALKAELMKPELDMSKINDIQSKMKVLQAEIADYRLSSILEVRKILTPQQFENFNALMDKHKSEREKPGMDDKD